MEGRAQQLPKILLKCMFDILNFPDNLSCHLHHDCKHNKTLRH